MESAIAGNCPPEAGMPLLSGNTLWHVANERLTISAEDGTWQTVPMVATAKETLIHQSIYEEYGCTVSVEIEMPVLYNSLTKLKGTYFAGISSNDSQNCSALATSLGLPESCHMSGEWSAYAH